MPKVKQPKTSQVTETVNHAEDTTTHVVEETNHVVEETNHAADNDEEVKRKQRISEIRAKWSATREMNKAKERAKEEEVRSTLHNLQQETESVKTKLSETSRYDNEIEAIRRELAEAVAELKAEKRRARTLKRVEIYGDDDDDDFTHNVRSLPTEPTVRAGNHPPPPQRYPPKHRTQVFTHNTPTHGAHVFSGNPFNTY